MIIKNQFQSFDVKKDITMNYLLKVIIAATIVLFVFNACNESKSENNEEIKMTNHISDSLETAVFGSGCFWCTEAIFERVKGVKSVISGYAGGNLADPTYEQVCNKNTGHAEVIKITYDPSVVSYDELLEIFWKTHDPTTPDRQGNDVGPQYRSIILFKDEYQKERAEYYKQKLNQTGAWDNPIVTEIVPLQNFYPAEDYHQDYFENNPNQGYCAFVIGPKVEKFEKAFKDKLKAGFGD